MQQNNTEGLTPAYFRKHSLHLVYGTIAGTMLVAALWKMSPSMRLSMLIMGLVWPFVFSPYTLKTNIGRVWWSATAVLYSSLIGCGYFGWQHPAGWLCAIGVVIASPIGVCLRWKPPNKTFTPE